MSCLRNYWICVGSIGEGINISKENVMSKIHFLPVKYGDSFVIECQRGDDAVSTCGVLRKVLVMGARKFS